MHVCIISGLSLPPWESHFISCKCVLLVSVLLVPSGSLTQVVCRMAGFPSAVRPVTDNYYGGGRGKVWLDDVHCLGHEANIDLCDHSPWGDVHVSCRGHHDDAGVVCSDGEWLKLKIM